MKLIIDIPEEQIKKSLEESKSIHEDEGEKGRSREMSIAKRVAYLGIGIALYVVLGCVMNIPLLANSHLQTDLGYIVFGVYCYLFGWMGVLVGAIGCVLESLLISGWFPVGWLAGQILIGIMCGIIYKRETNKIVHIVVTILAVFVGIAVIKTIIESVLYGIPLEVKFMKNFVAFIADTIPMLIGLALGYRLKREKIV